VALITGILLMKAISKFARTYYLSRSWIPEASLFSMTLFSTSLTIGIVTATFGRNSGFLDQIQFSVVMIAIVLSAIILLLFAMRFYPSSPKDAVAQ